MNIEENVKKKREIIVIAERNSGRWDTITLELIQDANALSKKNNLFHVTVFVFAKPNTVLEKDCHELATYGADHVVVLENDQFCQPNSIIYYTDIIYKQQKELNTQLVLFPSTPLWVECASLLTNRLQGTIVSNVTSFNLNHIDERLEVTKLYWKNKIQYTVNLSKNNPWIICLRPNVAGVGNHMRGRKATIKYVNIEDLPKNKKVTIKQLNSPDPKKLDLEEAERVIAGGRGVGEKGFKHLERLAILLGAAVGGTRVAVDNSWIEYSRQIGQTGKEINPKLYIAAGISGASQHVDGIREAEKIIAINKDEDAQIFELADLKVIGDANAIIPELIKQLEQRQKK